MLGDPAWSVDGAGALTVDEVPLSAGARRPDAAQFRWWWGGGVRLRLPLVDRVLETFVGV